MKLLLVYGCIVSLFAGASAFAQSQSEEGVATGFVSVHEEKTEQGSCLIDGAFMPRVGCLPDKNIDRDVRVPAQTCVLKSDGSDATLELVANQTSFQGNPHVFNMPGFANHPTSAPYVTQSKEDYSSLSTGVSIGLPLIGSAPVQMTTAYAISKVKVEFTADGHIQKITATRQTAPLVLGKNFGKWLDKVSCVFGKK